MTIGTLVVLAATGAPLIDVYTMGPGEHLFERFGHAAICVEGPADARCYNYGTTDFGSPPQELGYSFLRGDAEFWVSVWDRDRMIRAYVGADRTLVRQRLAVSPEVARRIAQKLAHDALPENRRYVYHHFDDNCSTRVRDVIDGALDGQLRSNNLAPVSDTFRSFGKRGLAEAPLAILFGDVLVGRRADRPLTHWDAMFLPGALHDALQGPLTQEREVIHTRRGRDFVQTPPNLLPWWLGASLLSASPWLLPKRLTRLRLWWMRGVAVLFSLLALLLYCVALISNVPELVFNELLYVWWPTDVLLAFGPDRLRHRYARVRLLGLSLVAILAALGLLIQPLFPALLLVFPAVFLSFRASLPSPPQASARS